MKRDIHKPLKDGQEVISKGSILGYFLLISTFALINGFVVSLFLLVTHNVLLAIALSLAFFISTVLLLVIYFIFIKNDKLLVNTVYIYYRYLLKRVYREGKPSRLSDDERFEFAWDNTISKFEEPFLFPDWVLKALENLERTKNTLPFR